MRVRGRNGPRDRQQARRREEHRGDGQARGHRRARVVVEEMPFDDHRAGGIADRRDHHGAGPEQLAALAAQVDSDQRHHSGEADEHAEHAGARRSLRVIEPERQQGDQQRDGRDHDRRDRGVDVLLARGDQRERPDHLDRCVGQDPAARPSQQHLDSTPRGEREEEAGAEHQPRPGEEERRDPVVDRDLDEEIGDAPDHRERREREPCPPAHRLRIAIRRRWPGGAPRTRDRWRARGPRRRRAASRPRPTPPAAGVPPGDRRRGRPGG